MADLIDEYLRAAYIEHVCSGSPQAGLLCRATILAASLWLLSASATNIDEVSLLTLPSLLNGCSGPFQAFSLINVLYTKLDDQGLQSPVHLTSRLEFQQLENPSDNLAARCFVDQ